MSDSMDRKYVDHPAPSVALMTLLLVALAAVLVVIPTAIDAAAGEKTFATVAIGLTVAVLLFFFWPLYSTYYTVSAAGLQIRYGPWRRLYPWADFVVAYWQKGMFVTRIGWPSVTPCVRLTDGVLLKRKTGWFGLYLTPNDPRAFLRKVGEFAPDLTREAVL